MDSQLGHELYFNHDIPLETQECDFPDALFPYFL